jgi:hypothetical protein
MIIDNVQPINHVHDAYGLLVSCSKYVISYAGILKAGTEYRIYVLFNNSDNKDG